jgi:hypothetical protein
MIYRFSAFQIFGGLIVKRKPNASNERIESFDSLYIWIINIGVINNSF